MASIAAPPAEAAGPFREAFTWRALALCLLRFAARAVRGHASRYYLRSPSYARTQVLVDTRRHETLRLDVRDAVDIEVIEQVFAAEDYRLSRLRRHGEIMAWVASVQAADLQPLILDLGANTGLASLYFAREFPAARILAVEPDAGNAGRARHTLRGLEQQVCLIEAGIASVDGRARIVDPGRGNWAYQTEFAEAGPVAMLTVGSLIAQHANARCVPFIAKIDIEGFEDDLFARNTDWFDRFPIVIVELHDWLLPGKGTSRNFLKLISHRDRDFVHIGENVFSIANTFEPPGAH